MREPIKRTILLTCVAFYLIAVGLRVVTWQNNQLEAAQVHPTLTALYKQEARELIGGNIVRFLGGADPPSDADVLLHPPGYSIFLAAVFGTLGDNVSSTIVQILLNSLAPILIFLIAFELLGFRIGAVAGALTAIAPQFAYHSSLTMPDELSAVLILAALYAFVLLRRSPTIVLAIVCGVFVGLSCWLRSNAMLLPAFFAAASLLLIPAKQKFRSGAIIAAAFVLTIAPITIRNYVYFDAFIPISLGAGTTLVEGIADYDKENRFGLPRTDVGVTEMDARLFGRPDYVGRLLAPDGVIRERKRTEVALQVIRENPAWFVSIAARRALSMTEWERVPAIAGDRDERENTPAFFYAVNRPLKFVQGAFKTAIFLPLSFIGLVVLCWRRDRRRVLSILGIVPLYYMTVQALLHTEQRYYLAMTHVLIVFAAVAIVSMGELIARRTVSSSQK